MTFSPNCHYADLQAARVFIDEATSWGLEVMTAPGEAIHIDWVNTTVATPDELIQQASKTYLDWYMLTQVRCYFFDALNPGSVTINVVAHAESQESHGCSWALGPNLSGEQEVSRLGGMLTHLHHGTRKAGSGVRLNLGRQRRAHPQRIRVRVRVRVGIRIYAKGLGSKEHSIICAP